jgi:hypothetical protein
MTKNFVTILSIVVIYLTGCCNLNRFNSLINKETIIKEGKGIKQFIIGKTKEQEIVKKLGNNYERIKHKDYSVEIAYKDIGLSFYFYQNDTTKTIFSIYFSEQFKGKTSKGIVLNLSTMENVIEIYGQPNWMSCDECNTWSSEYQGIEFFVERDKTLPHYPLNESAHINKKIIAISVTKLKYKFYYP